MPDRPILPESERASTLEYLALSLAVLSSVLLAGWVLWCCQYGIDFSDEGFYINWIAHHELYAASVSQFGFVYGPLYELVGRNFVFLRAANLLLTLAGGWFFFSLLVLDQRRPTGRERVAWLALAFVLSVSCLTYLYLWLPTPSYNTLTLQGLMLGGCGLGLVRRDGAESRLRGHVLLGAAGAVTFLAKPPAAVAAAPLFLVCLAIRRQLMWRTFTAMALACLLCLASAAWAIDGSIARFYDRLANAATDAQMLQSTYSLQKTVRFDTLTLTTTQNRIIWLGGGFLAAISWLAAANRGWMRLGSLGLTLAALIAIFAVIGFSGFCGSSFLELYGYELKPLLSYDPHGDWTRRFPDGGVLLLAWPLGALAVFFARFSCRPPWSEMIVALCMLLMPYAYVLGTNTNHWHAMGPAAAFWCAAGLIGLGVSARVEPRWSQFLPFAAAVVVGTVLLLLPAVEVPYRQRQPLRLHSERIIDAEGVRLRVPDDTAHYIRNVQSLLNEHGFKPGDPMIDLTGRSPALLHLIGSKPVGLAWLPGSYPGSEDVARRGLDRVPPETLRCAWVITEPEGPRALSPLLLRPYGLELARDYAEIGPVDSPIAEHSRSFKQYLYKPKAAVPAGDR